MFHRRCHSLPCASGVRGLGLFGFVVWMGALVGCSSAPPPAGEGAEPMPAGTSEAERVQAFLDSRYSASDVRHSFDTAYGQTVDCVDFFATPGVRALAARGQPITALPTAPPPHAERRRDGSMRVDAPQPAPASEGVDGHGHERLCPAGTVTQIRITPEEIARAGGLDAYTAAHRKHAPPAAGANGTQAPAPPQGSNWPCSSTGEFHDYVHVIGDVVDNVPGVGFGETTMSVYAPAVPILGDHSVAQVWMFGGTNAVDLVGPCTSNCVESIEIGWQVDDAVPNKNGGYDGVNPYIFIFSTLDGYYEKNCWNGSGTACPFVWMSQLPSAVVPGTLIPHTGPQPPSAGAPAEMTALIIEIAGDYWVQIGIAGQRYYIGYYPGTNFSIPMATFQVGGEVYDGSNKFMDTDLQMGTGLPASEGYGYAAYHHDYSAAASVGGQTVSYWGASSMCSSIPPAYPGTYPPYGYSTSAAPGSSSWDGYFYYGGTPTCTPTTCKASGATCGSISDTCGGTLACGTCGTGTICQYNECVCAPKHCPTGTTWNQSTCSCQVQCHSPATCCAQAGGSWNGHVCE